MANKQTIKDREVEFNKEDKKFYYKDTGEVVTQEELDEEKEMWKKKQEIFKEKTDKFDRAIEEVARELNVAILASCYFVEEDTMGVNITNINSPIQEYGLYQNLSKTMEAR